jgi:DNA-binding HxlR family transcriptional regulator
MPTRPPIDGFRGSLDLLVLKTLSLEATHGWGISERVQQLSKGEFAMNQGSLYPALQRLEKDGLIRRVTTGSPPPAGAPSATSSKAGNDLPRHSTPSCARHEIVCGRQLVSAGTSKRSFRGVSRSRSYWTTRRARSEREALVGTVNPRPRIAPPLHLLSMS